jgi:alcohol dehydrogenase, propanol-preferring
MRAMLFEGKGKPLLLKDLPVPSPEPGQILVRVHACGICRTDLHIIDGELDEPKLPLVPGHQVVGRVAGMGAGVTGFEVGERVGIPWLGGTCGHCASCLSNHENLCETPRFTGYQANGGFADYALADHRFCFPIPENYPDLQAAPLLCAGLIGYRSLVMAGEGKRLGIYGFGAAAHIVTQVARWQGRQVYAFTKSGDQEGQRFAREMGAFWAGDAHELPPEVLDAAIIFAPAGELVPLALQAVGRGGTVVCGGIHMSDIPSFPYELLWGERVLRSVANLTRQDGIEFLALAPEIPVRSRVQVFPLEQANEALEALRRGTIRGAGELLIHEESQGV